MFIIIWWFSILFVECDANVKDLVLQYEPMEGLNPHTCNLMTCLI
jgi:hypothetical protein